MKLCCTFNEQFFAAKTDQSMVFLNPYMSMVSAAFVKYIGDIFTDDPV
jgi:hypothetical protein